MAPSYLLPPTSASDRTDVPDQHPLADLYRQAAEGCAEAVFRTPWIEPAFVRASRTLWNVPAVGRFCRSVAYRLADRLFDSGAGYRDLALAGVPLRLDVGEWTTSGLYFANIPYEPATVGYLAQHLGPGKVFADVGANSGYFTLIASGLVGPHGRVAAFEPNPAVRERLERNIERNGFSDRVAVSACALSARSDERAQLFVPAHDGFATLVPTETHAHGYLQGAPAIDVRTRTFDDWIATAGIEVVSLMKIDVEGAEAQVLAGMSAALAAGRIERIVLETAWDGPAHRQLVDHGYVPARLESVGPVDNIAYTRV
jgi:FkbM family methyltransferase